MRGKPKNKCKKPLSGGSNARLILDALAASSNALAGELHGACSMPLIDRHVPPVPTSCLRQLLLFAEGTDGASPTPAARVTARAWGERAAALSNSTRSLPNMPGLAGE